MEIRKVVDEDLKNEALEHVNNCAEMHRRLVGDPDLAIKVELGGMEVWLCDNEAILTLLKSEIEEGAKCINGELNKYE